MCIRDRLFSLLGIPCITLFGKLLGNTAAGYTGAAFFFCLVNAITHYIMFVLTKDAPIAATDVYKRQQKARRIIIT